MEDLHLMLPHISGQAPERSYIEPLLASQAKPPHIIPYQIGQQALTPGCTQVCKVLLPRQGINKINGYPFCAASIQGVRYVHNIDAAHGCRPSC